MSFGFGTVFTTRLLKTRLKAAPLSAHLNVFTVARRELLWLEFLAVTRGHWIIRIAQELLSLEHSREFLSACQRIEKVG